MSSGGQIAGGVIGAVVGFYVGGPAGALQGAALGAGIGGYLDPPKGPTVEGPRLNDLTVQTSTYGAFIPRIRGTAGITGNLLWLENNKLKETVTKKKQGGKGGGGSKTTVKTYSYSATFAIGICQGPILGIKKIWCADKLIYNAGSDDVETIIASNKLAKGFRIYLGDDDQLPDSRYEANVGVGNAPAYRGLAYIVFYDFELADYSNTLQAAQFKFEVCEYVNSLSPSILSQYSALDFGSIYQAVSMYCSPWGEMKIFKGKGATLYETSAASVYVASTSGSVTRRASINVSDQAYLQGWSDTPCVGVPVFSGFDIIDDGGAVISQWPVAAGWNTDRLYKVGSTEYLLKWGIGSDTKIYRKDEDALSTDLISTTDSSSTYGRVYDIFPFGSVIFALTYSRNFVCFDESMAVLWSVDLSSQSDIQIGRNGSPSSVVRAEFESKAVIRSSSGKFWEVSQSGFRYLGATTSYPINYDMLGGDSLVDGVWVNYSANAGKMIYVNIYPITSSTPTVGDVVNKECILSSLVGFSDIDTTLLTETVDGYVVKGGTIRSAIEPLQGAFPFDVRQHGYKLQFLPRGQSKSLDIDVSDLGAGDSGDSDIFTYSREMDSQLPASIVIKYLDASREYSVSEQYSRRDNTLSVNRVDTELPIVMSSNKAAKVADVLQTLQWLERKESSFKLPTTYRAIEPGDVVGVPINGESLELRVTEINEDSNAVLEVKARPNRAGIYSSDAVGGNGEQPGGEIGLPGPSISFLVDGPMIYSDFQNSPGISVACTGVTSGWPGAVVYRSADAEQTWEAAAAFSGHGTIGYTRDPLAQNSGALIDVGSYLYVDLLSGELESVTQDQMLAGANIALYGADGRWEVIRFMSADLQPDGAYRLSGLIRGDKGTEWATGLHAEADLFVLANDPDNQFIGIPYDALGVVNYYRPVTTGQPISSTESSELTYRGTNLRPLSPTCPIGLRNTSGDLSVSFSRRSRFSSAWFVTGISAIVGEASESYAIDIMSGANVKRTITASSEAFQYLAAQQIADFGSVQSSVSMRIYQISELVGRGYALEVTL